MSSKDTHISDFFIQILKTFKRNVLARWNQWQPPHHRGSGVNATTNEAIATMTTTTDTVHHERLARRAIRSLTLATMGDTDT